MREIIKSVSKIMDSFLCFDGKTGVSDSRIAVIFPVDAPELLAGKWRQAKGIKIATDGYYDMRKQIPIVLPAIKHVSPCIVCRGDPDAEAICPECGGEGTKPCCECGQSTICRLCAGTGFIKEANEACLNCANTGLEAASYPIKIVEYGYASVKYVAFLQKYFPDIVFYANGKMPIVYFESPKTGVYGAVMLLEGITKSTRIYGEG